MVPEQKVKGGKEREKKEGEGEGGGKERRGEGKEEGGGGGWRLGISKKRGLVFWVERLGWSCYFGLKGWVGVIILGEWKSWWMFYGLMGASIGAWRALQGWWFGVGCGWYFETA